MRQRKPKEIIVGHAYRMWSPFCAGPSDLIGIVTEIRQATKTMRIVRVAWHRDGANWSTAPAWHEDSYGSFLRGVHSEVRNIIN